VLGAGGLYGAPGGWKGGQETDLSSGLLLGCPAWPAGAVLDGLAGGLHRLRPVLAVCVAALCMGNPVRLKGAR